MVFRNVIYSVCFLFLSPLFFSSACMADSATGSFSVAANVINSCGLTTTHNVQFGDYDPFATADAHTTGGVTVRCTQGTQYHIALDPGAHANGNQRRMSNGGSDVLAYDLYKDTGGVHAWGSSAETRITDTGNGSEQDHPVYATLPKSQSVLPGSYDDTIHVTVDY